MQSSIRISVIPAQKNSQTRALIVNSILNPYKRVICHVRIFLGSLQVDNIIHMMGTEMTNMIKQVGCFCPKIYPMSILSEREIGYIIANIRNISEIKIGDIVTLVNNPVDEVLLGYKDVRSIMLSRI
jgi:GTP-binding protein LepA